MYIYTNIQMLHIWRKLVWYGSYKIVVTHVSAKKLQGHNNNNNVKKNGHVVNQTIDLTGWPQMSTPVIHKPMFQLIQD